MTKKKKTTADKPRGWYSQRLLCKMCGDRGAVTNMWSEQHGQICVQCFKTPDGKIVSKILKANQKAVDVTLKYFWRMYAMSLNAKLDATEKGWDPDGSS